MVNTVQEVIAAHRVASVFGTRSTIGCLCKWRGTFDEHAEHVAAAHREARTITTREQLDALPLATIIYSALGHGCVLEKTRHNEWGYPGVEAESYLDLGHLPALVLWLPEDDS